MHIHPSSDGVGLRCMLEWKDEMLLIVVIDANGMAVLKF